MVAVIAATRPARSSATSSASPTRSARLGVDQFGGESRNFAVDGPTSRVNRRVVGAG